MICNVRYSASLKTGMVGMMGSSLSAAPHPLCWGHSHRVGLKRISINLATTAACFRLSFHLCSSFKKLSLLYNVPSVNDVWCEKAFQLNGLDFLQFSNDAFASTCSCCLYFFNGGETRKGSLNEGTSHLNSSRRNSFNGRQWTYFLLATNVLIYIVQIATEGKLLLWGAKINSLIDKGQFWRLATSSFLHANIGHLMVNCYSLNSVGPSVENLCGPRRFLAIYFTSALASSATSYWFCKAPSVGASGAIFGLVGSLAVFIIRHRGMIRGSKEDLQHIVQLIFLNMAIGILSKGVDSWGHLGGFLGGVATSWFVGPAWKYESLSSDGRKIFIDRAPIKHLIKRKREPEHLS